MKYPNTGLYTFCDKYSEALTQIVADEDKLSYYIAPNVGRFRGNTPQYIQWRLIDKLFPVYVKNLDIWHSSYQLAKYTGGNKKTKHVLTVHDLNFLYEKNSMSEIKKDIKRHQKRIDRADHIITISEFVKRDVIANLDLRGRQVTAIHSGCILNEYPGFNSPKYRPEKPYILALGTIIPKKNFHVLPSILKNNDYELVIAGIVTDYAKKIEEEARRHNVMDRLKIIGEISDQEKYWYLKNCAAFAFPSLAEGLGMPVLEAMRFGKPVFISNLTSLPEIGGQEAYYFENFDPEYMQDVFDKSMTDYFKDKNKSDLIKEHAYSFNWNSCAKKYYKVYQDLLK
ncbi:MAG: glycosyltransferase family 4 protein [Dysgonomonas sp.]